MIRLHCAILEADVLNEAAIAQVDVERTASVNDVHGKLVNTLTDSATFFTPTTEWKIYVANQDGDDSWPSYGSVRRTACSALMQSRRRALDPSARLDSEEVFGPNFQPPRRCIHLLVLVGVTAPHWHQTALHPMKTVLRTATSCVALPNCHEIPQMDAWIGGERVSTKALESLKPLFSILLPAKFYIRREMVMVWRVFKDHFRCRFENTENEARSDRLEQLVLVGSPGVGKSNLLLLMCMYVAIHHHQRVVLLQKHGHHSAHVHFVMGDLGKMYTWEAAPLLDGGGTRRTAYDRFREVAKVAAYDAPSPVWLCADSVFQAEAHKRLGDVRLDILCLPFGKYVIHPGDETNTTIKQCLVPLWSGGDMRAVAKILRMIKEESDYRYEFAGGNLRWFLEGLNFSMDAVNSAVDRISSAMERDQHISYYESSAEAISMLTTSDNDCAAAYVDPSRWRREVASSMARTLLPRGYAYV